MGGCLMGMEFRFYKTKEVLKISCAMNDVSILDILNCVLKDG